MCYLENNSPQFNGFNQFKRNSKSSASQRMSENATNNAQCIENRIGFSLLLYN